jgi:hypothetical protein
MARAARQATLVAKVLKVCQQLTIVRMYPVQVVLDMVQPPGHAFCMACAAWCLARLQRAHVLQGSITKHVTDSF